MKTAHTILRDVSTKSASTRRLYGKAALQTGLLASTIALSSGAAAGPVIEFDEQGILQINYALQVWAQNKSYTTNSHDGNSTDIFLRRNRITFSGQYNDLIGFYAQLESGNDSKGGNDDRSIYYRDAYITIDYSDAFRFIVGRFKNTFTRESLEACLEPLTLDRGDASYSPFGGSRDTGGVIWGNLGEEARFQYRFMFADGREGEYVPEKSPRLTSRVHWTFFDPEYDYGYRGTYLGTRKVFTIGAAFDYQASAAYSDWNTKTGIKDYKAWTVDGFWEQPFKHGTWTLSAAYVNYELGNAINETPDPALPANTELEGVYVKAGFLFPEPVGPGRLQVFARHDGTEYNLSNGSLDRRINSLGANYYINGQTLKLTLEHQRTDFANPTAGVPSLEDNNQTTFGFQFIL